ncbi:hypothetical protein MVI01_08360 [Myxococcus virescens]|uniref:Uncharacterized protein n=1 Tax=Myxococcus virescens TaxID=83456 RepID=A0A511H683_9BACT|nr:hypothetical protein MVI01_08360 [Myxococcus virescens]
MVGSGGAAAGKGVEFMAAGPCSRARPPRKAAAIQWTAGVSRVAAVPHASPPVARATAKRLMPTGSFTCDSARAIRGASVS